MPCVAAAAPREQSRRNPTMPIGFTQPEWLWLLLPLAAALLLVALRAGRRGSHWQDVCDPHLLHLMVERPGQSKFPLALVVLGVAWLVTTLALAGPSWSEAPAPLRDTGPGRVAVVDVSVSMTATDVVPTRMEAAKFKARDILARSRDRQAAVVIYAGDAYAISPLTTDSRTLDEVVEGLTAGIMPVYGSDASAGLRVARTLLTRAQQKRGEIILITDSADLRAADVTEAAAAHTDGFTVHVLVAGTVAGGAVDTAQLNQTNVSTQTAVWSRANMDAATEIATAGGGEAVALTGSSDDLDRLLDDATASDETDESSGMQGVDGGPYLALALLPLAALGLRRGWLTCLALPVVLSSVLTPDAAYAFDWRSLLMSADQRAMRAYEGGDFAQAARGFEHAGWRAAAAFAAGDFVAAAKDFATDVTETGLYNRATALAFAGEYARALLIYEAVLRRNPTHSDALHNHTLITARLADEIRDRDKQSHIDERAESLLAVDENPEGATEDTAPPEGGGDEQESEANRPLSASGENGRLQSNSTELGSTAASRNATVAGVQVAQAGDNASASQNASPEAPDNTTDNFANLQLHQSVEQMLQRVPDDVVGLLRNKLQLRFPRDAEAPPVRGNPW